MTINECSLCGFKPKNPRKLFHDTWDHRVKCDDMVACKARRERKPWVVSDSHGVQPGEQILVLGRFATHDKAAEFIGTLPEAETGRYNLDGPQQDAEAGGRRS